MHYASTDRRVSLRHNFKLPPFVPHRQRATGRIPFALAARCLVSPRHRIGPMP